MFIGCTSKFCFKKNAVFEWSRTVGGVTVQGEDSVATSTE